MEAAEVPAFVPRRVEELAARHAAFGPSAQGDRRRRNGRAAGLLTPDLLVVLAVREGTARRRRAMERPQGRGLDDATPRPGGGAPAAGAGRR